MSWQPIGNLISIAGGELLIIDFIIDLKKKRVIFEVNPKSDVVNKMLKRNQRSKSKILFFLRMRNLNTKLRS